MQWIRTLPEGTPAELAAMGKTFIWDEALPVVRQDCDYRPVLAQLAADTVIVEWDLAVSPEQIEAFTASAALTPDEVQVAPYRLYPASTALPGPVWAHRCSDGRGGWRWITEADRAADLIGFGLVYLPLAIVRQYLAETSGPSSDTTFSRWHYERVQRTVYVDWDVRPIHLHYRLDNQTDIALGTNRWAI